MYQQEPGEFAWILKVLNLGGQTIRLDRGEFTNMRALFSDLRLNILVECLELYLPSTLREWLLETLKQL